MYRWPSAHAVTAQIVNWIEQCAAEDKVPVLFCYSLGKAQRILYLLKDKLTKPVGVHGAAAPFCAEYENQEFNLQVGSMSTGISTAGMTSPWF